MLDYLADKAGYSRIGHHGGADGRWIDAHDWTIALFFQHDPRDHDPHLHIHNTVLNRVQCADGIWRTLDSRCMNTWRPVAAAVAERTTEEYLARSLSARLVMRPDGKAREVLGIASELIELASSRTRAITPKVAGMAATYEAITGRAPKGKVLDRLNRAAADIALPAGLRTTGDLFQPEGHLPVLGNLVQRRHHPPRSHFRPRLPRHAGEYAHRHRQSVHPKRTGASGGRGAAPTPAPLRRAVQDQPAGDVTGLVVSSRRSTAEHTGRGRPGQAKQLARSAAPSLARRPRRPDRRALPEGVRREETTSHSTRFVRKPQHWFPRYMPSKGEHLLAPSPPRAEPSGTAVPVELAGDLTLLTVEEAARRLSVGRTTLYALLKECEIPSVRIGRLRRIPAESLTDYAARLIAKQNAS